MCILVLISIVFVSVAATSFGLYLHDSHRLRQVSEAVTSHLSTPSEKVTRLTTWVHDNGGTSRNNSYFLLRRWRATPHQVLELGGDCADKSRLLAAMLYEIGIEASLVLCFNKATNTPAHTIVEARIEDEGYMAVDPTFDLLFPRENGTGYYGITDLRRSPEIVDKRIAQLRAGDHSRHEVDDFYMRSSSDYETASTFNWKKNRVSQFIEAALLSQFGESSYRIPRPRFLEEPTLLAASVSCVMALVAFSIAIVASKTRRKQYDVVTVTQVLSIAEQHSIPSPTPFYGAAN